MDEYIQLNVNFIRALQSNDANACLFFAAEIEKKFPGNENVKQFRDVLAQHSQTLHGPHRAQGGRVPAPPSPTASSTDSSSDSSESEISDDPPADDQCSDDDEEVPAQTPAQLGQLLMTRSSAAVPAPQPNAPLQQQKAPSIRDFVTMHPHRQIDDEVERMFAEADKEIAAQWLLHQGRRK